MKFTSRDLQDILEVVDSRIDRRLSRQPRIEYGEVDTVSNDGHTASVKLLGATDPSAGFRVPATFAVASGDFVRVTISPRGDRWVSDNLSAMRPRPVASTVSIDGGVHPTIAADTFDGNEPATSYPLGMSLMDVGNVTTGWPQAWGTVLTNFIHVGAAWQQYFDHRTGGQQRIWHRVWNSSNDAGWGEWRRLGGQFVPFALQVIGGATTTSDTGIVTTSEITAIPAMPIAVTGYIIAKTSGANVNNRMDVVNWDETAYPAASIYLKESTANYETSAFTVQPGGTNGRQLKYQVYTQGDTVTYYLRVTGAWY